MIKQTTTRQQAVSYVICDGHDGGPIAELIGGQNVNMLPDRLQVRTVDGFWADVFPGWAVVLFPSGRHSLLSVNAQDLWFQPEEG